MVFLPTPIRVGKWHKEMILSNRMKPRMCAVWTKDHRSSFNGFLPFLLMIVISIVKFLVLNAHTAHVVVKKSQNVPK